MKEIYRVTIHGRTLESRDLRRLLSRAVFEKRSMDRRIRVSAMTTTRVSPALLRVDWSPVVSGAGNP